MSDYSTWSVDDVNLWLQENLNTNEYSDNLYNQGIDGSCLEYLEINDCKKLCNYNIKDSINFKILINNLINNNNIKKNNNEQYIIFKNVIDTLNLQQNQIATLIKQQQKDTSNNTPIISTTPSNISLQQNLITSSPSPLSSSPNIEKSNNNINEQQPLKHLRASKDDSCEFILKNAMKRYNLNEKEWNKYFLVICYNDQEKILSLIDKPVVIFKNLRLKGLNPSIMLRRKGDFQEIDDPTPGGRL